MSRQRTAEAQRVILRYKTLANLTDVLDAQIQCGRISTAREALEMLNHIVEDLQGDVAKWCDNTSAALTDPDDPDSYDLKLMDSWRKPKPPIQ